MNSTERNPNVFELRPLAYWSLSEYIKRRVNNAVNYINRFEDVGERPSIPSQPVLISDALPDGEHHGWKCIAFGLDGSILISGDQADAIYRVNYR